MGDLFDREIHRNMELKISNYEKNQCAYCGCMFPSRNKLFKHLKVMDIDVRPLMYQIINVEGIIIKIARNIRRLEWGLGKRFWDEID